MPTKEIINREMLELKELLDSQTALMRETLGHGLLLYVKDLKKVRAGMVGAGLDVAEVDVHLDLCKGTKETKGLMFALGVTDDPVKAKANAAEATGEQRSIDDERDYSTHSIHTPAVRELVATILADEKLGYAAKVQRLNALEDGETEREGGARDSVQKVIRDARAPLVKQAKPIAVV